MKKLISLLLLLAMLLSFGFVAVAEDAPVYDGSEVTIRFYNSMGKTNTPVLDKYIVEFNKLYPNIKVEYSALGGYDDVRDQISKEIPEGIEPNVAYCYPDHVALYNLAKAVQTLDAYIDSTATVTLADGTTTTFGLTPEQKADFIEGYYNEGKQFGDGLMYTLPMSKSTEVLYYNKTFFDANGLTPPTTWD
ncbi:MAG: extracellular solute-binding protein, partial [Clostridia bacterium]|nr:extracellular solute-binding protein [Clostridia bacterium]